MHSPPNDSELLVPARKQLKQRIKGVIKRLEKQSAELREAGSWQQYARIADSLLSAPHEFPRGTRECVLNNVHTQQTEVVTLNPRLDVYENAELFYKKSRKGKRGQELVEENIRLSNQELQSFERLLARLDDLIDATRKPDSEVAQESLQAVLGDLEQAGIAVQGGDAVANKSPGKVENHPFRHFDIDGFSVFVGRNNEENDELTVKFAKPWDIWMHVTPHAGSHVVVRREKNAPWPPQEIILKAAALAVWFSKAKHVRSADVHVTEARFVHKPRKFPPGKVIAERCKTVHVEPLSPQQLFGDRFDDRG